MQTAILYPVFIQIFLTLFIGVRVAVGRVKAIRTGQVHPSKIALDSKNWPDNLLKLGNSYNNQFELPVLFYVLCFTAMLTNMVDVVVLSLSWVFIVSRIAHAYIHTTSNRVSRRALVFFFNAFIVGLLALYLLIRLLAAGL